MPRIMMGKMPTRFSVVGMRLPRMQLQLMMGDKRTNRASHVRYRSQMTSAITVGNPHRLYSSSQVCRPP